MKFFWLIRWLGSCNHKDIGTLYFILGILGGFVGRRLSLIIRTELCYPGKLMMLDSQFYKSVITGSGTKTRTSCSWNKEICSMPWNTWTKESKTTAGTRTETSTDARFKMSIRQQNQQLNMTN